MTVVGMHAVDVHFTKSFIDPLYSRTHEIFSEFSDRFGAQLYLLIKEVVSPWNENYEAVWTGKRNDYDYRRG